MLWTLPIQPFAPAKSHLGNLLLGLAVFLFCFINFLARGQFCDLNDNENTTVHCHNRFPHKRLAGEKFRESSKECFTGQADEKGYCRGFGYGQSCSNNGDADCDVDMYCSEHKVCEHAKLEGEYCNSQLKCASYLICAWEDGVDSRCRPYGHYDSVKQLGPGDEGDICISHYMNDDFKCEVGPKLTHTNVKDIQGERCIYDHGEEHHAHCWYHNEGKAICRRGPGDLMEEWNRVLHYLRLKPSCHVMLPLSQCDMGREVMSDQVEWEKTWYSIGKLHWEHQIEGVLPCMKQYVHPEIFKYEHHFNFSGYLSLGLITFLSLFLMLMI